MAGYFAAVMKIEDCVVCHGRRPVHGGRRRRVGPGRRRQRRLQLADLRRLRVPFVSPLLSLRPPELPIPHPALLPPPPRHALPPNPVPC